MADKKIDRARALRRRTTNLEDRLWQALRNRRARGMKFRRQHPIGPFVVDFACLEAKLVVEIDGYWHAFRKEQDQERENWLRGQGYEIVRFDIETESTNVEALAEAIAHHARQRIGD